MNKLKIKSMLLSCVMLISFSANSALTLDGTRYVYNGTVNAIPLTVTNQAERLFGGQVWLDKMPGTTEVPFAVVPNVFTLEKGAKQIVQVSVLDNSILSQRQESLLWLNLQEVPTKDKGGSNNSNALVMAARIKVKLLYRPESIQHDRKHAESNLKLRKDGASLVIENPTPYYFAVIKVAGTSTSNNTELTSFAPFSQAVLPLSVSNTDVIEFSAIDDWGAVNKFRCQPTSNQWECKFIMAEPIVRDGR